MDAQADAGVAMFAMVTAVAVMSPRQLQRTRVRVRALARWVARRASALRRRPLAPTGRPIELIAADVHRLGPRFHCVPTGVSFARFEARRQAYDRVLVEACHAVAVDHLLRVLPPGQELDRERQRVERALQRCGLRLDDAA